MSQPDLLSVANNVVRRAHRQGFVVAREIREAVSQAGAADKKWKEVVSLAGPALSYRGGRYYYAAGFSDRVRQEQENQRSVQYTVRKLIREQRERNRVVDRREADRVDFIQSVTVRTEDHREFTVLSRDISISGIRLISTRSLLGQKLQVVIPRGDNNEPWCFVVRILWTSAIGEGLFENGGSFLEVCGATTSEAEAT